jgi:hypothetical protein
MTGIEIFNNICFSVYALTVGVFLIVFIPAKFFMFLINFEVEEDFKEFFILLIQFFIASTMISAILITIQTMIFIWR